MEHDPKELREWADVYDAGQVQPGVKKPNRAEMYRAYADLIERHAKLEAEHADALRALKDERERAGKMVEELSRKLKASVGPEMGKDSFDLGHDDGVLWAASNLSALAAQEGRPQMSADEIAAGRHANLQEGRHD